MSRDAAPDIPSAILHMTRAVESRFNNSGQWYLESFFVRHNPAVTQITEFVANIHPSMPAIAGYIAKAQT